MTTSGDGPEAEARPAIPTDGPEVGATPSEGPEAEALLAILPDGLKVPRRPQPTAQT